VPGVEVLGVTTPVEALILNPAGLAVNVPPEGENVGVAGLSLTQYAVCGYESVGLAGAGLIVSVKFCVVLHPELVIV
jgi:hypothetical protein